MLTDKQKALVYDLLDAQEAWMDAERGIGEAKAYAKEKREAFLKSVSKKTGIAPEHLIVGHACITKMLHHVFDTSKTQNQFHQHCVFCGCPRDDIS